MLQNWLCSIHNTTAKEAFLSHCIFHSTTSRHFVKLYNLSEEFSNCYWVVAGPDRWLNKISATKEDLGSGFLEIQWSCRDVLSWHQIPLAHLSVHYLSPCNTVQFEAKSFQLAWLTTAPFSGWVGERERRIFVPSLPGRSFVQRGGCEQRLSAPQVWDEGTAQLPHSCSISCTGSGFHRTVLWSTRQPWDGSWQQGTPAPSSSPLHPTFYKATLINRNSGDSFVYFHKIWSWQQCSEEWKMLVQHVPKSMFLHF